MEFAAINLSNILENVKVLDNIVAHSTVLQNQESTLRVTEQAIRGQIRWLSEL